MREAFYIYDISNVSLNYVCGNLMLFCVLRQITKKCVEPECKVIKSDYY